MNRLKWLAFMRLATYTTVTHRTLGSTVTVGIYRKYSPVRNDYGNVKDHPSGMDAPVVTFCQRLSAISRDATLLIKTLLERHPRIVHLALSMLILTTNHGSSELRECFAKANPITDPRNDRFLGENRHPI